MAQNPWPDLSSRYAMCVAEFYEAVAHLGRYRQVDPKLVAHWQKIKELQALCLPIEKEIDRHLGLEKQSMDAHSY
jgi:hypothetical protein